MARGAIERCAALDWDLVISGTRHLSKIENWITIASSNGAKLSQLFSVRVGHSGDGKSKDTAIFFKKARTHLDAMQAFYKYLEQQGIEFHERHNAGFEDGYVFEFVMTDKGPLWVKYQIGE